MSRINAMLVFLGVLLWGGGEGFALEAVEDNSGHHFAFGFWRDNAFIGLDFGHNPYGRSVSFATAGGRRRLARALEAAVEAYETRMSFDFGFDFRSVLVRGADGGLRLGGEAMASVEVFLEEVASADTLAQSEGRRFAADVVLTDFRMADDIFFEGANRVGEHPDYITNGETRRQFMAALKPVFRRLGNHERVTLNLMNEPEGAAISGAKAVARIEAGQWSEVRMSADLRAGLAKAGISDVQDPAAAIRAMGAHVRAQRDRATGEVTLALAKVTLEQLDTFLLEMYDAILAEAPAARVTIGWMDDQSALAGTRRLEDRAGGVVTDVVSFHVYDVRENPYHPLTTRREHFKGDGPDDRTIRITEWGLGGVQNDAIRDAIQDALLAVQQAGFEGVLFWWDGDHRFDREVYREAVQTFAASQETPSILPKTPDFDGNGFVDFADFLAFAQRFGTRAGDAAYDARFDLDEDEEVGFGDFVEFARHFGEKVGG